jgi:hypothetical protein
MPFMTAKSQPLSQVDGLWDLFYFTDEAAALTFNTGGGYVLKTSPGIWRVTVRAVS